MSPLHFALIGLSLVSILLLVVLFFAHSKQKALTKTLASQQSNLDELNTKYSHIVDAQAEADSIISEAETRLISIKAEQKAVVELATQERDELAREQEILKATFDEDMRKEKARNKSEQETLTQTESKKREALKSAMKNEYKVAMERLQKDSDRKTNEIAKRTRDLEAKHQEQKEELDRKLSQLEFRFGKRKEEYDELYKAFAVYNEDVELAELGFYKAQYDYDDSESYKRAIDKVKEQQKSLVRLKNNKNGAFYCPTEWTVGDSRTEGRKMTERSIRLTSRAFNNECDAAIAKCTWKNVLRMEERIKRAFDSINKVNESNHISITKQYLELKLKELKLTHEYKEKKQREKEEQAEIREQMREEQKIEQEIKRIEKEAEEEEKRYSEALEQAKNELLSVEGEKRNKLEDKIIQLREALQKAEEKHQRAESMAQQTRQGHVYVISNVGSFGENVYKIGMTRRLEPMDRVKELGDASVPFTFDVHAMIHTDDAPALEKKLHDVFDERRVNAINRRKEFFEVTLDEIKKAVQGNFKGEVEFTETALARDYYETKAMRDQKDKLFKVA
ncbi:chromosome segregation ATPase [Vibrio ishigakensis]|uniref:Chromosome segregation ATPase n=1 Tax=Vibrio ishigakensis TaxID=1481914 RepID=A0A0B8NS71_9VIBR|nr:DUF4041 domain-containing protein [Vibrio ishigakensis]GAM55157.1 chromosome segregation ATPase [Vibrio ishigakensis]